MAIANLQETLLAYTLRKSNLVAEIGQLNTQKNLALIEQKDVNSLLNASKSGIKADFKKLWEESPELQEKYNDYTEMPEFQEEMDKVQAMFQQQLEELNNWETELGNQITTNSTEMEEITAWIDSYKSMLSGNIQNDFSFSLSN